MATHRRDWTAGRLRARIRRLLEDLLFPLDQWDRDQRLHWIRWLGTFKPSTPAKRIYNAIQCPHLLVYLAWALEVDRVRIGEALRLFPFDPKRLDRRCGAQSAAVRELFPWDEVEQALDAGGTRNIRPLRTIRTVSGR